MVRDYGQRKEFISSRGGRLHSLAIHHKCTVIVRTSA